MTVNGVVAVATAVAEEAVEEGTAGVMEAVRLSPLALSAGIRTGVPSSASSKRLGADGVIAVSVALAACVAASVKALLCVVAAVSPATLPLGGAAAKVPTRLEGVPVEGLPDVPGNPVTSLGALAEVPEPDDPPADVLPEPVPELPDAPDEELLEPPDEEPPPELPEPPEEELPPLELLHGVQPPVTCVPSEPISSVVPSFFRATFATILSSSAEILYVPFLIPFLYELFP